MYIKRQKSLKHYQWEWEGICKVGCMICNLLWSTAYVREHRKFLLSNMYVSNNNKKKKSRIWNITHEKKMGVNNLRWANVLSKCQHSQLHKQCSIQKVKQKLIVMNGIFIFIQNSKEKSKKKILE